MVMRRELQNTLQSNTGAYRQRSVEENQTPTLGQAQMNFQQQAVLGKGSNNRYYAHLDKWHRETVRRILDPAQARGVPGGAEALEFRARCVMRGIPEAVLDFRNIRRVTATRSLGYGSPELRDMATKELVALIPYMDETGRNHALRARASALPGVGMHYVDSFFPPIEKAGVPNAHAALAVLENNALRMPNGSALVEPQQNHSTHFDVHMSDVMRHVQNPASPPQEKLLHMEQAGPHLNQHLNALRGDPTRKNEVQQKEKMLQQLGKVSDQLGQQVQEAMAAQAQNGQTPPQQPSPEMAKVMGELQLKGMKTQGELELKARKHAQQEQLADAKTASGIQRETARAKAAIQTEAARTAAATTLVAQKAQVETAKARHAAGLATATTIADTRRENMKAVREARRKDAVAQAEARRKAAQPKEAE
jgi:hypothetical protein